MYVFVERALHKNVILLEMVITFETHKISLSNTNTMIDMKMSIFKI